TGEMKTVHSWGTADSSYLSGALRGGLRLSPDGRFLAVSWPEASPASAMGIYVIAVGNDQPYRVASAAGAFVFGWSPVCEQRLYVSDQSGTFDLWSLPMKDGRPWGVPASLKKDIGWVRASGISDSGNVYYSLITDVGGAYTGDLDVEAATVRNLQPIPTPRGQVSVNPRWSSDGSHLLINRCDVALPVISETARVGVVIQDVATGQERVVLPPKASYPLPDQSGKEQYPIQLQAAWARDGKSLMFALLSNPTIPPRLVLADLQTGS